MRALGFDIEGFIFYGKAMKPIVVNMDFGLNNLVNVIHYFELCFGFQNYFRRV